MKSNIFLYIASNLILLQLLSLQSEVVDLLINILCALGIMTLGIAHGAIDNILYGAERGRSRLFFIAKYLMIVGLFALLWFVFPNLAFLIFMAVSAYHFGQSQFVEYDFKPELLSKVLFALWGSLVLLFMLHFNGEELLAIEDEYIHFAMMITHLVNYSAQYLTGVATLFVLVFSLIIYFNKLRFNSFFKETYLLALLALSFYMFPPFIAFALFFVWIHSLKVMLQEFKYCKEELQIKTIGEFIRLFLPLTIYSLLGTSVILLLVFHFGEIELIPQVLLILLSCVTIPHSFVMDRFYGFVSAPE